MGRHTITLDPEAEFLLRQRMEHRRISFKQAVNEAVHLGLGSGVRAFKQVTHDMGALLVDETNMNKLATDLEDAAYSQIAREHPSASNR